MKFIKISILLSVLFSFNIVPAHAYIEKNTAVIRIMNKAAGKARTVSVPIGKNYNYDKLNLKINNCKQTDPFDPENFFVFIEISKSNNEIFSGWMNRNEPGYNPLQDADYDLWIIKCE